VNSQVLIGRISFLNRGKYNSTVSCTAMQRTLGSLVGLRRLTSTYGLRDEDSVRVDAYKCWDAKRAHGS
jgi:hypothetical protein